jgi:Carbohydrate esterase, sialic acid-specific acetylesterase
MVFKSCPRCALELMPLDFVRNRSCANRHLYPGRTKQHDGHGTAWGGEPSPQNQGRLMMYTSTGEWLPAKDPLSAYGGAGVGPGLSFADRMATLCSDKTIGVVMCAKGGTYLSQWMPDYMTHSLYGAMIAKARQARAYGTIKGLLWYQGEADTVDRSNVLEYSQRMHVLFSNVRQDLGIPDLPIIFVQLGPGPNDGSHPYWHDIQVYQQYIDDAQPDGIAMVSASDLQTISATNYHLNQQSQIILGGRLADAMFQITP